MSTVTSPIVLERNEITSESVQRVFDAACLNIGLDDNGYLIVTDSGLRCVLRPDVDGDEIVMYAAFGLSDQSSDDALTSAIAEINETYKMIRAAVHNQRDQDGQRVLVLDYLLCTAGGVTAKNIICAWRRFVTIVREATHRASVRAVLA